MIHTCTDESTRCDESVADGAEAAELGAGGVDGDQIRGSERAECSGAGVLAQSEFGGQGARGRGDGPSAGGGRSVDVDEHDPCGRSDAADHRGALRSDDDEPSVGAWLWAGHAASFGSTGSALVHRSKATRGTTMRDRKSVV